MDHQEAPAAQRVPAVLNLLPAQEALAVLLYGAVQVNQVPAAQKVVVLVALNQAAQRVLVVQVLEVQADLVIVQAALEVQAGPAVRLLCTQCCIGLKVVSHTYLQDSQQKQRIGRNKKQIRLLGYINLKQRFNR